jgi:hypothetical protein
MPDCGDPICNGARAVRPGLVITGGSAAFPIRDFLTRANVDFVYRDDEGPPDIAVCTLADGTRLELLGPLACGLATGAGAVLNKPDHGLVTRSSWPGSVRSGSPRSWRPATPA